MTDVADEPVEPVVEPEAPVVAEGPTPEPVVEEPASEPVPDEPVAEVPADEAVQATRTFTATDGATFMHNGEVVQGGDTVTFSEADESNLVISDLRSRGLLQ